MTILEYALDATGINRVQISPAESGGSCTVLLNRSIVGSISNIEELIAGRTFTLWDGSVLTVRLLNNQYVVMRNGQFLRPMSGADIAAAEAMAAEQAKRSSGAIPYAPQGPYSPQQPSGAMSYPPQGSYPPQYPNMVPSASGVQRNSRAQSAMINGFFSLAFSLLTLFTLVGFAGIITGTFAIVYGFMGLSMAGRLPDNAGRGQAITGIVLGFVGWFVVIVSFILRSTVHAAPV